MNNARRHLAAGHFLSAEHCFRLVLEHKTNSPDALTGVGLCLVQRGFRKAAASFFDQAAGLLLSAAKKAGDFSRVLDLAFQLNTLHETEKALDLSKKALIYCKHSARAHHIHALCLQKKNRIEESYRSAKRAVRLAPGETNAAILLASLESRKGLLERAKNRLEALVVTPLAKDLPRVYRELGVVSDRLGEYEKAFACFQEAGRLRQQSPAVQKIDKTSVYRDVAVDKRFWLTKTVSDRSAARIKSARPAPLFLIGFYRSGTTLMEQILASHPRVVGSDEAPILPELLYELMRNHGGRKGVAQTIASLTESQVERVRQDYWRLAVDMLGRSLDGKVLVDKTALNTLNLSLIDALFPDATVLFAVRDPRDVCLSCFMQSFGLSPLTVHFLDWKETARFYALILDYWLSIRDRLRVHWIQLRYEDVIDDLEGQFKPVVAKLGLEWVDQCREFYLQARKRTLKTPSFDQVTQPVYQSSTQRWRNYARPIREVLPILEKSIRILGYEIGSG